MSGIDTSTRRRIETADPSGSESNADARPLVSIIVPSFNQGSFIRRTLDSILTQDYRPIQVIVIDGASTDDTISILEEFSRYPEIEWVSESDSGVVEAVNKGFARARGEIGAIQSSDDFYLPGAVNTGVNALIDDPDLAFVFGDVAKIDTHGRELSRSSLPAYSLESVLSLATWIPQPSTFFRLGLAKKLGGWRSQVSYAADTDLWLRMALQRPARKIDRLMAQRSMHAGQRDTQRARIVRDYALMIDLLGPAIRARGLSGAARAGTLLMANRYGEAGRHLSKTWRLWQAVCAYPKLLSRVPALSLVPGGYAFRDRIKVWLHRTS